MHGVNKLEFNVNVKNDISRLIRCPTVAKSGNRTITAVNFNNDISADAKILSAINCVFLEPNEQLGLTNLVSVVPFLKFDPQPIQYSLPMQADRTKFVEMKSGIIPLSIVPDGVFIYAKPTTYSGVLAGTQGYNFGDFHYVIQSMTVSVGAKTSQLLNFSREQLYDVSLHNGVDMEYNEFIGNAVSGATGNKVALSGSVVYLKFGKDIVLPAMDVASGVGGNYSFSVVVQLMNQTGLAITVPTVLYIVPVYSGFLESKDGKTNVRDIMLEKSDVMNQSLNLDEPMTDQTLQRMVGGSWLSKISSIVSKGIDVYKQVKPHLTTLKNALPEDNSNLGKVRGALKAVGAGVGAGKRSGGSISDRLMC